MNAGKVTLSPEMLEHLSNPMLSNKKKRQLRINRVVDYVSQLNGRPAPIINLIYAAGYDAKIEARYKSGWGFIRRMVSAKQITLRKDGGDMYWGLGDNNSTELVELPAQETVQAAPAEPIETPKDARVVTGSTATGPNPFYDLRQSIYVEAKEFAWEHNSDSLREFISWLRSR